MQSNGVVVFHVFLHITDGGLAGVIHLVANPFFIEMYYNRKRLHQMLE
jgi:hypothetical protein